ncbi:MAG TPA: alkaline phosphatase D family protein [Allosphingosinicella sp.]
MKLNRREFAALAAAFGASLALGPGRAAAAPWRERREAYPQGVASGDPDANSVILWTRRAPEPGVSSYRLAVEVAEDRDFARIVARGTARADASTDWTCRFLAAGLLPAREYHYRFTDQGGAGSRVGRTLTAPAEDDDRPFRFAFVSCQDITQGACNAYRRMIHEDEARPPEERLGFVLHLGDFIYEVTWYAEDVPDGRKSGHRIRGGLRYPDGEKLHDYHLPTTLRDYRTAYSTYLLDPDLQDARARFPFVPVWDNHEFSWQGYQSQQVFDGNVRPAQTKKVAANQAWFEYQPARVVQPGARGGRDLDRFHPPVVRDAAIEHYDDLGVGQEPNNLAAINSLKIFRSLKYGRNADLILTDNRSFQGPGNDGSAFGAPGFPLVVPEEAFNIVDGGRDYDGGRPPATIAHGGHDLPNPAKDQPRQSYLGGGQKAWLLDQLGTSRKPWKIWGHSFGTLRWRTDIQNLPDALKANWPGTGYGLLNGGFEVDHGEIADALKREGITGLAIVAGDKHSFWAGTFSKHLPPRPFEPVAVEFVTGSISARGLAEAIENMPRTQPLRALYVHDGPNGPMGQKINMTIRHGVRASLELARTGDLAAARRLSNPAVAPHLAFTDLGGHGYATVRVSADALEAEFVCIPRPFERNGAPDGGPLAYRVRHRVPLWRAGEPPRLIQEVVEGDPPFAI